MQIREEDNCVVFLWEEGDPTRLDFKNLVKAHYKEVSRNNIVVDISSFPKLRPAHIIDFTELSSIHKEQATKSFVLVVGDINISEIPQEISVAPTLTEALDVVEMEEIERDLGYE